MIEKIDQLKKVFVIVFVLALVLPCFAQDKVTKVEKELDSVALKMFENVNNRDYDAIMDMTHPKVFEIVPKEMMVTVFKTMFEGNEEFTIDIPKIIPEYKISEVFKDEENDTDFAFVSYEMKMSMIFHNEDGFDEEGKEMMIKAMKMQGMEAEFASNSTINVVMPNSMAIMLNDESTANQWSMINYDADSPLFFQVLSAKVLEKAKDYYQNLMIESKKKE